MTFLYILVDLLVDLSLTGGVLQSPENPPPPGYGLDTAYMSCKVSIAAFVYTRVLTRLPVAN